MARKRMIDPDFWSDQKLGTVTRDERLFFMGLISHADDEGRGRANVKLLKSNIFPYDEDLKSKDISKMLQDLAVLRVVILYNVDGQEFYYLPNFLKHQNINRSKDSLLPEPNENNVVKSFSDSSVIVQGIITPNIKEVNINKYNVHALNLFFDKVWLLYPRKEGKAQVTIKQKDTLFNSVGEEQLVRCIVRYKTAKKGVDKQYLQMGSTFFNSGYVDYLDKNFTDEPQEQSIYPDMSKYNPGGVR